MKSGFQDHNLANINPLDEQFEPTEAEPIRQRARMAGDPPPQYKELIVKREVDEAQGKPAPASPPAAPANPAPATPGKYTTSSLGSSNPIITKKRGVYSDR